MRTAAICPTCAVFENALCILYNGEYLANADINPLDSLEVALEKINDNLVPVTGSNAPTNAAIYLGQLYVRTAGAKNLLYAQTDRFKNIIEPFYNRFIIINLTPKKYFFKYLVWAYPMVARFV